MVTKKAIYIGIGLMAICATTYATILAISPLPLVYIDKDRSGFVSIEEALNTLDIATREVLGQPECIEYFWLKDGLAAWSTCPNGIRYEKTIKMPPFVD